MDEKHEEEHEDEADDLVDGELARCATAVDVTVQQPVTLLPPVPFTCTLTCPFGDI